MYIINKAHDYVITSGARRKEQRWDPKENEQVVPEGEGTIDMVKVLTLILMYIIIISNREHK